jgi:hypothetical protein
MKATGEDAADWLRRVMLADMRRNRGVHPKLVRGTGDEGTEAELAGPVVEPSRDVAE